MTSSILQKIRLLTIEKVTVTDQSLSVLISDGRTISVPLDWYPRLLHGSDTERNDYYLIAQGRGIHWEALDEDISLENIIEGKRSQESPTSFRKWLHSKQNNAIAQD